MMKKSFGVRARGASLKALALAAGALGGSAAHAAAFQLMEGNASGLGNAYAGSAAVAEDASTVFFNPAGMSLLPGRNVAFSVNFVRPQAEFSNRGSQFPATGSNGGDAGDWAAVPAGYFTMQLTDALTFGLGLNAPFGLKTEYDRDWAGRFHAVKSEIKTYNLNPSLAYKVNEKLAIGVGISYQRIEAELSNFVGPATLGVIEGDDNSWGWNIGAIYQLTPSMRLGLAYRSKIEHRLKGDLKTVASIPVSAEVELPDTATLSVHQVLNDRWEMMGDISWTGWSSLQRLQIRNAGGVALVTEELRWDDSWRVAFGGAYKYTSAIRFKFGLAWDQTPVSDRHRLPRVPDEDRVWLTAGVQWKPTADSALDVGYAHIFVRDAKIDTGVSAKGRLVGEYENAVDILGLQYSTRF